MLSFWCRIVQVSFWEHVGGLGAWSVEFLYWVHFGIVFVARGPGVLSFCGGCISGLFSQRFGGLGAGG